MITDGFGNAGHLHRGKIVVDKVAGAVVNKPPRFTRKLSHFGEVDEIDEEGEDKDDYEEEDEFGGCGHRTVLQEVVHTLVDDGESASGAVEQCNPEADDDSIVNAFSPELEPGDLGWTPPHSSIVAGTGRVLDVEAFIDLVLMVHYRSVRRPPPKE